MTTGWLWCHSGETSPPWASLSHLSILTPSPPPLPGLCGHLRLFSCRVAMSRGFPTSPVKRETVSGHCFVCSSMSSVCCSAGLCDAMRRLLTKYDNLFECSFPYSMGWHGTLCPSPLSCSVAQFSLISPSQVHPPGHSSGKIARKYHKLQWFTFFNSPSPSPLPLSLLQPLAAPCTLLSSPPPICHCMCHNAHSVSSCQTLSSLPLLSR